MKKCEHPLPEPEALQMLWRKLAALDLIMSETKWLRVHLYEPDWTAEATLGIVDNGAGDNMHVVFAPEGVVLKGCDHMSSMSPHAREEYEVWPGIYDEVPAGLLAYLRRDPNVFDADDTTFCLWRSSGDAEWRAGEPADAEGLDDGADFLLGFLESTPEEYADWAGTYFDKPISLSAVQHIYNGQPVTEAVITELNPERDVEAAMEELKALGFI
ncbi:hypothetical protein J7E73_30380 [Paenibacillus albidus]|uniref:hypothetical protein n=1 Tax=Paenibacillus albidus TaxID=2041023 RepID=UPI001BE55136|nr:hypothetical protein [Paenibacillus albidus]MBT2293326.1 hypothetical protein [Paenibacillus albidus]